MTIQIDQIEALLLLTALRVNYETSKKRGFRLGQQLPVYLNLKSKTGETALIAHPESGIDTLRDLAARPAGKAAALLPLQQHGAVPKADTRGRTNHLLRVGTDVPISAGHRSLPVPP